MTSLCTFLSLLLLHTFTTPVSSAIGPCDIFGSSGNPCVAAHSLVRALYSSYNGPLYQVVRSSDNSTLDIGVVSSGGYANAAAQDDFCVGTNCFVLRIYDQTTNFNHLSVAPPGHQHGKDSPVNASRFPFTLNGHKVYGAYFEPGMGYRNDNTSLIPTGNDPETIYMITSGTYFNSGCCFDYGNAETNNNAGADGTMEAVNIGNNTQWGRGAGKGPWVLADLENGLWPGNSSVNEQNLPQTSDFVVGMVKGGSNGFGIKAGDATESGGLKLMYEGERPNGYQPMKKQGAIILGIGGDNSAWSAGLFFEGCFMNGYTSDSADASLQENIVSVGYGK